MCKVAPRIDRIARWRNLRDADTRLPGEELPLFIGKVGLLEDHGHLPILDEADQFLQVTAGRRDPGIGSIVPAICRPKACAK